MTTWDGTKLRECFESGDLGALAGIYSDDALLDVTVGPWRFQRQGVEAVIAQFEADYSTPYQLLEWRERSTPWGAVVEVDECHGEGDGAVHYRYVHLLTVEEGKITEDVIYCSGGWDRATRERWAREAPMVRR